MLGGKPEYMARQQALKEDVAQQVPKADFRFVDDESFDDFSHEDRYYRTPRPDWDRVFDHFSARTDAEQEEILGQRRPAM